MEINTALSQLRLFWHSQNIQLSNCSIEAIKSFEKKHDINLPDDFARYFQEVNGMASHYPNDTDEQGFLFYPLDKIKSAKEEFESNNLLYSRIFIFSDYMQQSWEYYVSISDDKNYEIGIIPAKKVFKPMTNSLAEFIHWYMNDDEILYKYE